jgi:hypothetical protein
VTTARVGALASRPLGIGRELRGGRASNEKVIPVGGKLFELLDSAVLPISDEQPRPWDNLTDLRQKASYQRTIIGLAVGVGL